jgi:hypothetical protein
MARGAALPKSARYVKPNQAQIRLECSLFGVHHRLRRYTPDQAREACQEGETCQQAEGGKPCGQLLLPSNVEDCERLAPHLLSRHPVYIEDQEAEGERQLRQVAPVAVYCAGCHEPMPAHLDPSEWYCRHCHRVNNVRPDGSVGVFKAAPFSPEVERCNGLAKDKPARRRRKVSAEPERVDINRFKVGQIATPDADIPF